MRLLRCWIFYIISFITMVPVATLVLVLWPLASSRWRYEHIVRIWLDLVMWLLKVLCGLTFEVRGEENLPPVNDPIVVLCKHQSAWETLFLPYFMPQRMSFVYKVSLHWLPFFGWALKSMGMMGIDRGKGAAAFKLFNERGRKFLKSGWWVMLFPEGTRVAPGKRSPYKTGGARFAIETQARILPVAHNAGVYWPRNSVSKKPGTIIVSIGPVIETKDKEYREVITEVEAWIETEVQKLPGCAYKDA